MLALAGAAAYFAAVWKQASVQHNALQAPEFGATEQDKGVVGEIVRDKITLQRRGVPIGGKRHIPKELHDWRTVTSRMRVKPEDRQTVLARQDRVLNDVYTEPNEVAFQKRVARNIPAGVNYLAWNGDPNFNPHYPDARKHHLRSHVSPQTVADFADRRSRFWREDVWTGNRRW